MDKKTHVKQDEWAYPATKTAARAKAKRARSKAKRNVVKKSIKKALGELP